MTALLKLQGVSKSFAGIRVLKDVDFDVQPGEVHALLGENGAGKSTLIKIIAGVHAPDAGGTITLGGPGGPLPLAPRGAQCAASPRLPGAAAVSRADRRREHLSSATPRRTRWGGLDWPAMRGRARQLLDSLDSHDLDVDAKVGTLSVANRQRVEIAKALSQDARVLIMDEPTAALAEADVRRLIAVVKRLRERGVGDRLRQPSHGRDLRAGRPRHRAARRRLCRHHGRSPRSTRRRWSR